MGAGSTKNQRDIQRRAQAEADGMPLDKAGSPKYVFGGGAAPSLFCASACVACVRVCGTRRHVRVRACVCCHARIRSLASCSKARHCASFCPGTSGVRVRSTRTRASSRRRRRAACASCAPAGRRAVRRARICGRAACAASLGCGTIRQSCAALARGTCRRRFRG